MKQWLDDVLALGFAYGPGGTALQGKIWMQAVSIGGSESVYTREGRYHFTILELLRPFEQSAHLCGVKVLEPFLSYEAVRLSPEELRPLATRYQGLMKNLVNGQIPDAYRTY